MTDFDVEPVLGEKAAHSKMPFTPSRKDSETSAKMTDSMDHATEPVGSAAPAKDHRSAFIFARLREDLPPPSERRLKLMLGGLMLIMVLLGWVDGSFGPLFPFLQTYYHKSHLLMSMVYVATFGGGLISGATNVYLTDRLGFGLVICLGCLMQTVAYALMGSGGPYPLFVVSQVLIGWGFGLQDSQTNSMVTRLPNASRNMFLVQACFGLGATVAPFISTPFAAHVSKAYLYYFVSMGVGILTLVALVTIYQGRTEWQIVAKLPQETASSTTEKAEPISSNEAVLPPVGEANERADGDEQQQPPAFSTSWEKMRTILTTPVVYAIAMFMFLYVACEIAIGGWATSFLIADRGGNANAGYVTTGYYAGLTIGRIVLIPLTNKLGFHYSVFIYTGISLVLELVIWFTHSLVGNSVCYALIGLFFGPVFPAALMVVAESLSEELRSGSMGLMGSIAGAGAALGPFIVGALSDRYGLWVLQPLMVAMMAGQLVIWAIIPILNRRSQRGSPRDKARVAQASAAPATQAL